METSLIYICKQQMLPLDTNENKTNVYSSICSRINTSHILCKQLIYNTIINTNY